MLINVITVSGCGVPASAPGPMRMGGQGSAGRGHGHEGGWDNKP